MGWLEWLVASEGVEKSREAERGEDAEEANGDSKEGPVSWIKDSGSFV